MSDSKLPIVKTTTTTTTVRARRPGGLGAFVVRRPGGLAGTDGFIDAISAAGDALDSLSLRADALAIAATSQVDQEQARLAKIFATRSGPRSLERAKTSGDAGELQLLQRGLRGVTENVTDALVDDAIERFLLMDLGLLLAGPFGLAGAALGGVPAATLDAVREAVATIPTPPAPQELPVGAFVGGGALIGAAQSFAMTGNPRASIGGAAFGGLLGFAVHRGMRKLGDMFSVSVGKKS